MNQDFHGDFSDDGLSQNDEEIKLAEDNYGIDDRLPVNGYYDVKLGFKSQNQLLWIEPIDKYNISTHITTRGKSIELEKLNLSMNDLLIHPKGHELEDHNLLMDKLMKIASKRNKNMRRYPQYDPENSQEDLFKFKNDNFSSVNVIENYDSR